MSTTSQTGSIILILLIVITLTSISSFMVLQSNLSFAKQINLAKLNQRTKELALSESKNGITNFAAGINFNSLPVSEVTDHQLLNYSFSSLQTASSVSTIDFPLAGYSINDRFKTQLIELTTNIQSSLTKTRVLINGLGCLLAETRNLSDQIETIYSLDLDRDSNSDVNYHFDSGNGEISKVGAATQLLLDIDLDANRSFGRPAFALFNLETKTKLALVFVVQNTTPVSPMANNRLYLIFDNGLFDSHIGMPINPNDLVDINLNPNFSINDKGYFLNLNQGQLISTPILLFNRQIIFVTQSPATDPNTGTTRYSNNLVTIHLNDDLPIKADTQTIASSDDLFELQVTTQNHQQINLRNQFGSILSFPGECRLLYSHEN